MNKEYTSLGFMSGTSGDGVDASIISSDGNTKYEVIKDQYFEYESDVYKKIHNIKRQINSIYELEKFQKDLNDLENKITLFHAKIGKEIIKDRKVDIIGFHGQTIYHNPKEKISLQLGNGKLLFQLSKKKIVFNFRKNDIQNGGEGAPLTPIFHRHLIQSKKIDLPVCILNIGGISNLTIIENTDYQGVSSQDVGPGNCLINSWIQAHTNQKFDINGKISNSGKINEIILEQALEIHENNFQKKNNISLDTNDFDISFARGLNLEDGAATLIAFTAKIITANINYLLKRFNKKGIKIILCGGGRKNISLIKQIQHYSEKNLSFHKSEDYDLNGDFIESQAFGYLSIRTFFKLPISFPSTTRCKESISGGVVVKNF